MNQPMNGVVVDLGPLRIPSLALLRFQGVAATRTTSVFLTAQPAPEAPGA